MKEISALLVYILLAISAYVAAGMSQKRNMWKWICLYWVALAIKNFIEFLGVS